jgi:hypothetical protein
MEHGTGGYLDKDILDFAHKHRDTLFYSALAIGAVTHGMTAGIAAGGAMLLGVFTARETFRLAAWMLEGDERKIAALAPIVGFAIAAACPALSLAPLLGCLWAADALIDPNAKPTGNIATDIATTFKAALGVMMEIPTVIANEIWNSPRKPQAPRGIKHPVRAFML